MLSEVKAVTLGVSNLQQACAFYENALGYRVQTRAALAPDLAPLWRFDSSLRGEYAMLAPDDSGLGRIRLVAFDAPGQRLWNAGNLYNGSGYYALNFRCRDALATMQAITAAGGSSAHEPSYWEVSEQVAVRDSINDDPDGIRLDVFSYEKGGELRGPLNTNVSVVQTIALATRDVARSVAFYRALGFEVLFDRVLDFPELQTLLGTDRPVRIHNVNLIKDGHIVPGRVEMFAYLDMEHLPDAPLRDLAVPPNIGILSATLLSDALDVDVAQLQQLGAELIARAALDVPGFGPCAIATLLGPDGEQLELLQPV
ncbi:VOC family protein [Stenotrophomonas sp.]|uniref:VOC family protein n=1 Tax=Stenotrophomonas sp. TaxID=69392 RepID=UPI0028B1A1C5|nr:VOC family protein [Stenotrophomonas sp.]